MIVGPILLSKALATYWANVPMNALDTQEPTTYSGDIPLCSLFVRDNCVVNSNTIRLHGLVHRIRGFHPPMSDGKCEAERQLAKESAKRVSELLSSEAFTTHPQQFDVPDASLFTVTIGSRSLAKILIDEGLAKKGRDKDGSWCEGAADASGAEKSDRDESWGRKLNPSGEVPETGFKAVFFERQGLFPTIVRENTETISMQYSWDDFHGIDATEFGAYWVGELSFDRPTKRTIGVRESGVSRIRVNGDLIYETKKQKREFTHTFAAGQNILEVEYVNAWHTVGFKVTILEEKARRARSDLATTLEQMKLEEAHLLYAGIYEASTRDSSVKLDLATSNRPLVLWLDSYEPIDWIVPDGQEIALAIIGSHSPGSNIQGGQIKRTIQVDKRLGITTLNRKCTCRNGWYRCEHKQDLADARKILKKATGLDLAAYHVANEDDEISFTPFDGHLSKSLKAARREDRALKQACKR